MVNRIAGVFVLLVGGLAPAAFAQGGSSMISGTVFDQAQAVLPGVIITVTNEATGIVREAVTGPEGQFVVPTLSPGTYSVRADLPGFQSQEQQGVVLRIGQEVEVNYTLPIATVAETVTVTGEAPIIEVTASRLGSMITQEEIQNLPAQGYNHLSLMQVVPGMVPNLDPGEFEGGNFNVNGQGTARNLWTMDGAANQDTDGGGTGPQARIALDAMAEFQVLTHQYTAEYGGASGVIVNAVTKSGTNSISGAGFTNIEDSAWRANDPFAKAEGDDVPDAGRKTFGFNLGGPIVQNRAFFFFNLERNLIENAVVNTFPSEAAALATNYSDATHIRALSTFSRVDYTAGGHNLSFRWQREVAPAVGEDFECCQTLDNRVIELDSNDRMINVNWTALIGSRATNELRFSHVGEDRVEGNLAYMSVDPSDWNTSGWIDGLEYVGLNGRDQFDIGSTNAYEDFTTGLADAHGGADSRNYTLQNSFTMVTADGDHTMKAGFTFNRVEVAPQRLGGGDNGVFSFQHNTPFDPANAFTYPSEFEITLGDFEVFSEDDWLNGFVQDQWRAGSNLTLNVGLRLDSQDITDGVAVSPRAGFAYDVSGAGNTIVRGGFGKFADYHLIGVPNNLNRRGVFGQVYNFATDEDNSWEDGVVPGHPCLQPIRTSAGHAAIGPACRALLADFRTALQPGAGAEFVNPEPWLDGDRKFGYLWGYSIGVERQVAPNLGVSVDYVGNRGRDRTGRIDISEGPEGPNGRIVRLTPDEFDPDGALIPAGARNVDFGRVFQYQSREEFNTDFDSLELSLEKRFADRWSSRVSYTLAYSNDMPERPSLDRDPRADYGRSGADNRHGFVTSVNFNLWRGLTLGGIFRHYSGYPINETIGSDVNGDRDNVDRPVAGIHDDEFAIVSELDANGRAVRNGIDGNSSTLLDLRLNYVFTLPSAQTLGVYLEAFNALNKVNLGNPTGNRNSSRFLVADEAGTMRSLQLGFRYSF